MPVFRLLTLFFILCAGVKVLSCTSVCQQIDREISENCSSGVISSCESQFSTGKSANIGLENKKFLESKYNCYQVAGLKCMDSLARVSECAQAAIDTKDCQFPMNNLIDNADSGSETLKEIHNTAGQIKSAFHDNQVYIEKRSTNGNEQTASNPSGSKQNGDEVEEQSILNPKSDEIEGLPESPYAQNPSLKKVGNGEQATGVRGSRSAKTLTGKNVQGEGTVLEKSAKGKFYTLEEHENSAESADKKFIRLAKREKVLRGRVKELKAGDHKATEQVLRNKGIESRHYEKMRPGREISENRGPEVASSDSHSIQLNAKTKDLFEIVAGKYCSYLKKDQFMTKGEVMCTTASPGEVK